jgi:hypothetical protein
LEAVAEDEEMQDASSYEEGSCSLSDRNSLLDEDDELNLY